MDSSYSFAKMSARKQLPVLVVVSDVFCRKAQCKKQWPVLFLLFIVKTVIYKVLSSKSWMWMFHYLFSVGDRYVYVNLEVFFPKKTKEKAQLYRIPFFFQGGRSVGGDIRPHFHLKHWYLCIRYSLFMIIAKDSSFGRGFLWQSWEEQDT